jgi:hypothetical protein
VVCLTFHPEAGHDLVQAAAAGSEGQGSLTRLQETAESPPSTTSASSLSNDRCLRDRDLNHHIELETKSENPQVGELDFACLWPT